MRTRERYSGGDTSSVWPSAIHRQGPAGPTSLKTVHWTVFRALSPPQGEGFWEALLPQGVISCLILKMKKTLHCARDDTVSVRRHPERSEGSLRPAFGAMGFAEGPCSHVPDALAVADDVIRAGDHGEGQGDVQQHIREDHARLAEQRRAFEKKSLLKN